MQRGALARGRLDAATSGMALLGSALGWAMLAALAACDPKGPNGGETRAREEAMRASACEGLLGPTESRVSACLESASAKGMSRAASEVVGDIQKSGALWVVGPIPNGIAGAKSWSDFSNLHSTILATDEAAVSKALRAVEVRGILVHRDLSAALDRDRVVLARLANHDELRWFQLRYVADDWMVYTVRGTPSRISASTGAEMVVGLRARLEGRAPEKSLWAPETVRLIGILRLQGEALVVRHAVGGSLDAVLDELADKLRRRWEREVQTKGIGSLADRLADARVEVHVVLERAPVEPRGRRALADLWEMGVDGAMLQPEVQSDERFAYLPGSEAVTHSFRHVDDFLQHTVDLHEWRARRPWEDPKVRLDLIRDEAFIEAQPGGGAVVSLFRGMPEVAIDEVTDDNLRQMLIEGAEWWLRNQRPDGSFTYKYWPDQNRASEEYNEVRHILSVRDFVDAYRYHSDPRYLEGAKRSMDWLMAYAIEPGGPTQARLPQPPEGTMLFRYPLVDGKKPANQKLGTVAVALLGWIDWAQATGSHAEDGSIRKMAQFTRAMLDDKGRFEPYFVKDGHPYRGSRNDIVPGEAALALGRVADYFDDNDWIEFFPKFLDYYEPWFRARAAKKLPGGRWPAGTYESQTRLDLVQFGPWAVMASRAYYQRTGDERAAKFGLEIADWMIDNYQWSSERAPFSDYTGGYFKMTEELPAMQTFCYSEGTAAAYAIARKFRPESKQKYARATRESLRFLRQMQYDEVDTYFAARADLIDGGVKYAMNEAKIRTDYVGHAMSTVSQFLDARAADPESGFQLSPWAGMPIPVSVRLPERQADGEDAEESEE